jgi:hypothetical protein
MVWVTNSCAQDKQFRWNEKEIQPRIHSPQRTQRGKAATKSFWTDTVCGGNPAMAGATPL